MTSAQQVRNVLSEEYRDLIVEAQDDGSTVVRDATAATSATEEPRGFPVSDTLCRCADLLADEGFVIALVRDKDGVYLNAH
jgi:hypothetical protein